MPVFFDEKMAQEREANAVGRAIFRKRKSPSEQSEGLFYKLPEPEADPGMEESADLTYLSRQRIFF
jgi:hypothetical protein